MTTLIGLSGSLRAGSFNTALLRAARDLMPEGATLDIRPICGIPLYDGDVEAAQGLPEEVTALKDAIAAADGLLLATPEYNNSIPGVLKNAVDWLSRPDDDIARVWRGRPVAVMGTSTGAFGTTLAQAAWLPVWRTLGAQPFTQERMIVPRARDAFTEDGALGDDKVRGRLRRFLAGFVAFAAAMRVVRG